MLHEEYALCSTRSMPYALERVKELDDDDDDDDDEDEDDDDISL
jgi:hypothetical protein